MPPTRLEDDDSADESDMISARTLALTRYKRNHEFMNEVFMYAAFSALQYKFSVRLHDLSFVRRPQKGVSSTETTVLRFRQDRSRSESGQSVFCDSLRWALTFGPRRNYKRISTNCARKPTHVGKQGRMLKGLWMSRQTYQWMRMNLRHDCGPLLVAAHWSISLCCRRYIRILLFPVVFIVYTYEIP